MSFLDTTNLLQQHITLYVVQPLLILFVGIFLGKLLEQFFLFVLAEFHEQRYSFSFLVYTLKWAVYIATIVYLLDTIHALGILLVVLACFVAAIILASIVLGLKDFFPNFLKFHSVQDKHKPGSSIKTKFGDGKVVNVQLGDLHIKTNEGDELYIPNSSVKNFLEK